MCNYVLFCISYLLFALQLIWFLKRFLCDTPSRACKTRSESRETNNPPVRLKYLSDRRKNNIYVISLPSATLWIVLRIFDFSLLQTSGRYLLTSALKSEISPRMLLEMNILKGHVQNTFFLQTLWYGNWTRGVGYESPEQHYPT